MNPSDKRKNKFFPSEFKGGTKTPEAEIKLKQVNDLKYSIIDAFQQGNLRKFYEKLGYLKKNQANNKKRLAKSLCDITKQIPDNDIKLELFAEALEANPSDPVTLNSYATALANNNQFDKAFELFELSKNINPDETVTLNSYATALANNNQFDKAFELFELSKDINPDDTVTLNSYATALANNNQFDKAFELFELSKDINPDETVTLNSYATALANNNQFDKAFELSKDINPDETVTLTSYATALANNNQFDKAFELFELSKNINPDDTVTLNSYATALANNNQFDKAFELFELSLKIDPDDRITLFIYATWLENKNEYKEAITKLEIIKLENQPQYIVNLVYFKLGYLYYITKQKNIANKYFNLAIENSEREDVARLKTAKQILSIKPFSKDAIKILTEITEKSNFYEKAHKLLSSHLATKEHFEMFNQQDLNQLQDTELQDTEMLNRTMYHKIKNEISILLEIVHEIIADKSDEILLDIRKHIQTILDEIQTKRQLEESKVKQISLDDYTEIMTVISQTAHDIVDFVNNELAIIQEDIAFMLPDLAKNDSFYQGIIELQDQLLVTQTALDDLKAVNEGIKIRNNRIKVKELFEKWQHNPKLKNATISLNIKNPESELYSDAQKIKSFISELIDNSIKHNSNEPELKITISSKEINEFNSKCLVINYWDNGKGISRKRKDWVFLPLKTTKPKISSGLGLFMIKRTLREMNGTINEQGKRGVNFEIKIPYGAEI